MLNAVTDTQRGEHSTRRATLSGRLLTTAAAACIGVATLVPAGGPSPPFRPFCVGCGELSGTDIVLNVLLFLPLGVGLGLLGVRRRTAISVMVAATLTIELLQFI